MRHRKVIILLVLVALAAAGASASAETGAPGMPAGFRGERPQGPPSEQDFEKIEKKVEAVRVWRMTEELSLSEEQVEKFMPLVSSIEQRRRDLFRDRRNVMKELRVYLDARSPDEGKIREALAELEKHHDAMEGLRKEEIEAVKGHLSTEQQARYLVFQQEFQREIRDLVMKARGGRPGGAQRGTGDRPTRPDGPMGNGPESSPPTPYAPGR